MLHLALMGNSTVEVIQPTDWEDTDLQWIYQQNYATEKEISIHGKLTVDMALYYDTDQIRKLYNIDSMEYKTFCRTGLKYLESTNADERRELLVELTKKDAFNYLSERTDQRLILYYVCLLSQEMDDDD